WITYFYTSVFHREYNDLNLCDISQRFADEAEPQRHLVLETNEEDAAFVDDLLRKNGIEPSDFIVCMQLGASEDSKRWAETQFAGLARLLAEKYRARIVLAGVREEAPLGQVFEQHAPGIATHLYGETSIPQLAALLKRSRFLVTNDTGTMHIAAAVDCKVLLVSVGFVHFRETGPYGAGHCAIERRRAHIGRADNVPGGLDERMLIRPEQAMQAVEYLLAAEADGPVRQMDETPDMAQVDLYTTRFAPDGYLAWYPVLRRPLTERDLVRIAYRAMWIEHLSENEVVEQPASGLISCYAMPEPELLAERGPQLAAFFEELAKMARRGIELAKEVLVCLRQTRGAIRAKQILGELKLLDEEMRVYSELHGACKPLTLIARYERDNLEGADPILLAETTLGIYKDCETRASLMRSKLELALSVVGGK
ncbi:MAG: glycosyltransferase family 9 protein, partial [Candidatus Hydrogenedentes bacterium]|nr:glycosyltransferase family 9 protein [Candidatus Hydrogenedentota bacterium]